MKKITLLGLFAILAISVEGCTIGETDKETATPKPSPTTNNLSENQNQSKESPKETTTPRAQRVSGLIPATNPDVRVSGSVRGRRDPFALVSIKPQIAKIERNKPKVNGKSTTSRGGTKNVNNVTGVPTIDGLGNQAKNSELQPLLLAEQVIITGIVRLGGVTKVIVKAPEEAYARHVGIGERVSNGLVLIKRIEGLNSATPKVVLEQKGVEIKKGVGELPGTEENKNNQITAQVINELPSNRSLATEKTWLPNFLSQKLKDSKNN